jgi:hypothetical protein
VIPRTFFGFVDFFSYHIDMKTYCIYYLPNAIRELYPGIKGKVGMTYDAKKRYYENKCLGLDMTGYVILFENIATKQEAKRLEHRYQQILRCVDGTNSAEYRKRNSEARLGKKMLPRTQAHRDKLSAALLGKPGWNKGISPPKSPCQYCGLEVSATNMKRWHGDQCKQKP